MHPTLWHLYTDDHRGQLIAGVISNSDHITLNTKTPECQTLHYNKHLHQISQQCLTHYTIGHRGQLNMYLNDETLTLPIYEHLQLHTSQYKHKHNIHHICYTNTQHLQHSLRPPHSHYKHGRNRITGQYSP